MSHTSRFIHEEFSNGLVLLAEPMSQVRAAAVTILLPAGSVYEPSNQLGMAGMVSEWLTRGAGRRDGRSLVAALDALGTSHSEGAHASHTTLAASTLGRNLAPTLEILADLVLRPKLSREHLEPIRDLCLQGLRSLEDDPSAKVLVELRRKHLGEPWGRPSTGTIGGIESVTQKAAKAFQKGAYRPNGAIIAIAGAMDWAEVRDQAHRLIDDWSASECVEPPFASMEGHSEHITKDTQQIQIAMAYPASKLSDADYYATRAAAAILGGYASSRLFVEVREKRGLCYSVYSSYESLRAKGSIVCHAGTAAHRAQETLDVMVAEIRRIAAGGVSQVELDMMRAGLKSSLIMQQESTLSRASSLGADWYHLGRVRSLEEIAAALDGLTTREVSDAAAKLALSRPTVVTLGPSALVWPG